jgi:dipeptidyl aminopeptidase/acylaminoacyl peptidase
MSRRHFVLSGLLLAVAAAPAFAQPGYQRPPKAVTAILDAPAPAQLLASPTGNQALMYRRAASPSIAEVSAPMLRIAGVRIDPKTNGRHLTTRITELSVLQLGEMGVKPVKLPPDGRVSAPEWAPDGKRFAAAVTFADRIELWVGDAATGELKVVPGVQLNAVLGDAIQWMAADRLLCVTVPAGRGDPPAAPAAPPGPVIQESEGKAGPVWTFQDLLQNAHDESLFEYYATAQLAVIDAPSGKVLPVGKPAIITAAEANAVGEHILVTRLHRPFSYLHPHFDFPRAIEVWELDGRVRLRVADLPLQDKVPLDGVPTGPREVRWHPSVRERLVWVEALDGGDPKKKVSHRDAMFTRSTASDSPAVEAMRLENRFIKLDFFAGSNVALVQDYDRDRKWVRTLMANLNPETPKAPVVLFERSRQDRYNDPGTPVMTVTLHGQHVIRPAGGTPGGFFLIGPGGSPKGDRPFLDRFDPKAGKAERLWQSGDKEYAEVAAVLDGDGKRLLVRRETPSEPTNYFLRTDGEERQLTRNVDPAPDLRRAKKQLVTTKRADGTVISFTLHTPPDFKEGERLPAVFYAYPIEFASRDTAGQVTGSPYRFTTVTGYSHLFFLTQGYAVMEVSMPIVGPPASANDTFVEQLVANAKAAIDKAADLGVIDQARVGVMGHSYGAFMTANLLAHSDLFRAGIARSGAYNRTLTPFGFQNERRTIWEAPEVYGKMSPFYHAHKINEPLLLIHGIADNNSGTFPIQSERLYVAIKGNGGKARLVMLPHESHGYLARESVEHVLYEQIAWFDKYVKGSAK